MAFDPTKAVLEDEPVAPRSGFNPMSATAETAARDEEAELAREAGERLQIASRTKLRREQEAFRKANTQPGAIIDFSAELPASLRARASFEGDIDKRVDLLNRLDSSLGARKAKGGDNIIVRIEDEEGNPKDVLLYPMREGVGLGDVAGAAGPIVKLAGAAAAATGRRPLMQTAVLEGLTGATIEGAASGTSRALAGQDIDVPQLAGQAAEEGAVAASAPLAMRAGKAGLEGGRALVRRGMTELEKRAPGAAERLGMDATLAERTGSPLLARLSKPSKAEEEVRQRMFAQRKKEGVAAVAGQPPSQPVLSEGELAARAQPILAEVQEKAEREVGEAMTDAQRAAQKEIQDQIARGTTPVNLPKSDAGRFIRNAVVGDKEAGIKGRAGEFMEQAERLYRPVNELAEKEGIVVSPAPISALRKDIDENAHRALLDFAPGLRKIAALDNLLTKEEAIPTGVLGAGGKEIVEMRPPPPLTLQQARELRSAIFDAIQDGLAIGQGGTPNAYLKRLVGAVSEAMDDAVKGGSPELQAAAKRATDFYRTKIEPLQQSDVAKLFLKTDAAGRLGDDEIITRLTGEGRGNLDAFRAYKEVLGEKSPEFALLRRAIAESVIEPTKKGGELIKAAGFLERLNKMDAELATEIFGPSIKNIRANASIMAKAQGANIPREELEDALNSAPGLVGKRLERALEREKAFNMRYQDSVRKQLVDGVLTPRAAGTPETFVTRFINNPNTTADDIRQALVQIGAKDPTWVNDARRTLLTDILENTRLKGDVGEVTTRALEDLDFRKIGDYIGSKKEAEKIRAVVGEKGMEFLGDVATYAEVVAKRKAIEEGRKVSPETVIKEGASGFFGFLRNSISAVVDVSAALVRNLGARASLRTKAVEDFITKGELPAFLQTGIVRTSAITAPQIQEVSNTLLAEKLEPEPPPPLASRRNP